MATTRTGVLQYGLMYHPDTMQQWIDLNKKGRNKKTGKQLPNEEIAFFNYRSNLFALNKRIKEYNST
jgi:hypothetical protein